MWFSSGTDILGRGFGQVDIWDPNLDYLDFWLPMGNEIRYKAIYWTGVSTV
jgi:hypothetical protein